MSSFSLRNFMVLEAGSNHKQEHNSTDANAWISCSKFCLEQDPNNRELLCQLSVLERRSQCIGETEVENPEDITGESIKHAKEAIALDGISWYALGRVCLSAYYMTGTLDHNMLLQSTKAYKNSAKDQKMMHCAELWYNCSMAYKFLENYLMALTGLIMDPNLKSLEQTLNLCDVLDYINSLLQKLNDAKQLSSPTSSSLPTVDSLASVKSLHRLLSFSKVMAPHSRRI